MKWFKQLLNKLTGSNRLEVSEVKMTIYIEDRQSGEKAAQAFIDHLNSRGALR